MCVFAYALGKEELLEEACTYLPLMESKRGENVRAEFLELLTMRLDQPYFRKVVLEAIVDKEINTRKAAYEIVRSMHLQEKEYQYLEGLLKYKANDIRIHIVEVLAGQQYTECLRSIRRLMHAKKTELRQEIGRAHV